MMNVIWQPKALKHLKKIGDRSAQERILAATRGLAAFPACPNIKSLANHEYTHRLRVGNQCPDWLIPSINSGPFGRSLRWVSSA
ncbi:hypothetical protein DSOUD_2256 [Desulfuromonas soudanensis]|uniref:Uncharacterized protein n=1 Tax=Desulfuromonas soudanensis TaxID=1603606 RepID=A0A0M4DJ23_9BACT|nr:hypothetical protein [Desulfuromonas soudanensis]ALC17020.1 hypothetical protein DSOUD_2256 [Desulfuromonas soudanensis]